MFYSQAMTNNEYSLGMQPVLEMVALCGEDLDNNLLQEGHKVVA